MASPIFSSSPFDLGSSAKVIAGGVNWNQASLTGRSLAVSVSPVFDTLSLATAPMSPQISFSVELPVFPWSWSSEPVRSVSSTLGFHTVLSEESVPLATLSSEMRPLDGSLSVLNTSAASRLGRIALDLDRLAAEVPGREHAAVGRRRRVVVQRVEERRGADAVESRRHRDGQHLALRDRAPQAGEEVLVGERSLLEELLHQGLVALGHRLDQLAAPFLDRVLGVGGDLGLLALAVAVAVVDGGLAAHQVDRALQVVLVADRNLHRQRAATERGLQLIGDAEEIGALAIELGDVEDHRDPHLGRDLPHPLGHDLDAGGTAHAQQRGVGGAQAALGLGDEDGVAGAVEQVDLVAPPGGERDREIDRDLALDLLLIEIGDGVAVFDLVEAIGDAGGMEQGAGQGRLAGVAVTDDGQVPDLVGARDLHSGVSSVFFGGEKL